MKGLSPLIAVVILIAVTITIVTIISTWVTDLTEDETTDIANKSSQTVDCTGSNIEITDVYIDVSDNLSRIIVQNTGFVDETITSASMMNKNGESADNLTVLPIDFPRRNTKTILFNTTDFNLTNETTACQDFSQAIVATLCTSDTYPHVSSESPRCN